jgi:hypothetical protein
MRRRSHSSLAQDTLFGQRACLGFVHSGVGARVSPASAVTLPPRRMRGAARHLPGGPAAPGNVARGLQALPEEARRLPSGRRGGLGLGSRNERARVSRAWGHRVAPGGAPSRPQENFATSWSLPNNEREVSEDGWAAGRQDPVAEGGAPPTRGTCSAGEGPLSEPSRALLPREPRSEGPKVLYFLPSIGKSLRGHREMLSSLLLPWGMSNEDHAPRGGACGEARPAWPL